MTKWQEFPLRPQGRPWVGINTRAGRLDDGSGQQTDESINCMINRGDVLEKRKGLIRGLDERFAGVVCGLHRYTDECGIEHLLVADEDQILIRSPFAIPVFEFSDAYPFDSFQGDGLPDTTRWNRVTGYRKLNDALRLVTGATPQPMVWFKEAANASYQLRITYAFDITSAEAQTVNLILKAATADAEDARLEATIAFDGVDTTSVQITHYGAGGVATGTLFNFAEQEVSSSGTITVSYPTNTRLVHMEWFPDLTDQNVRDASAPLTALQDADLGQFSAIQLAGANSAVRVDVIDGGPI